MARRAARLLVPVLFGTFLLNVFGGYAIARMSGMPPGFPDFWLRWLLDPEPRQVQHLWFLVNLALYTFLLWPLYPFRSRLQALGFPAPLLLCGLGVASAVAIIFLKPHAPALAGDNYQFAHYLVYFAGGCLIGARLTEVSSWLERHTWKILLIAVLLFLGKTTLLTLELLRDLPTGQALARGGWVPIGLAPRYAALFSAVEAATAWAWCLAAVGLAARYLRRPNRWLAELNRAVFPFYVLHFPVTLVGLALAAQIALPWPVEFLLVVAGIYGATWVLWRAADRLGPFVLLIGGRPHGAVSV